MEGTTTNPLQTDTIAITSTEQAWTQSKSRHVALKCDAVVAMFDTTNDQKYEARKRDNPQRSGVRCVEHARKVSENPDLMTLSPFS